jgi:hypothetical protein
MSPLTEYNLNRNIVNLKETKKDVNDQDKKEKKEGNRSNKGGNRRNGNDNNNGGGGFLEPIIEDIQGFIKGRRAPVVMPA